MGFESFSKTLLADCCGYNRKYSSSYNMYNKKNKKIHIHPDRFLKLEFCSKCNIRINHNNYSDNYMATSWRKDFIFCSLECWDNWLNNK
jgi:hypothetical protein